MRRVLLVVLASPLLAAAHSPMYLDGSYNSSVLISVGMKTRFYGQYRYSGFPLQNLTTNWPVSGVPAPTVVWDARDPTGALGITSHTFALTGSTESGTAPFNRTGDFATPSGGMEYRRFDGTNDWYQATDATIAQIGSSDFTVCGLFRAGVNIANFDHIIRAGIHGATEGWAWTIDTTAGRIYGYVHDGASGVAVYSANSAITRGAWTAACMVVDYDGNSRTCGPGPACGAVAATPNASAIDSGLALTVGAASNGNTPFHGDAAIYLIWSGTTGGVVLTLTQQELIYAYLLGHGDLMGSTKTLSNTGPYCLTYAGQLECFSDNMAVIGSELPPGVTGAGSPASCMYVANTNTNSIVQSNDFHLTWSCTAGAVPASTVTPYADGRLGDRITDNDAGASEECESGNLNITALDAGDKVQITFWAHSDSAQTLNVMFEEGTGGVADGDSADVSVTTTWTRFTVEGTVDDTANTVGNVHFCPGSGGCGANPPQGHADIIQVGVWMNAGAAGGQAAAPPYDIPTTTAAVSAGNDLVAYAITGRNIVNAAGALVGPVRMSMRFAQSVADVASGGYILQIAKDGTDFVSLYKNSNETFYTTDGTIHGTTAAWGTPGTLALVESQVNYTTDLYWTALNSTRTNDATADASPTGMTTLRIGSRTAAATSLSGGFWICDAKVEH